MILPPLCLQTNKLLPPPGSVPFLWSEGSREGGRGHSEFKGPEVRRGVAWWNHRGGDMAAKSRRRHVWGAAWDLRELEQATSLR